jgi:hypothetical protein
VARERLRLAHEGQTVACNGLRLAAMCMCSLVVEWTPPDRNGIDVPKW